MYLGESMHISDKQRTSNKGGVNQMHELNVEQQADKEDMQWQCKIESNEEYAESDKQEGEKAKSKQQHTCR